MAGSNNFGSDYGPSATINVTPLVDVMLVLLVIFMVTAPMMQQGVEVNLPKASSSPLKATQEQLVLSVDREGRIFLGSGNELSLEVVGKRVAGVLDKRPVEEKKVYIKADTALNYGRIMDIMGKLHEAGITQIGLVSAPVGISK